MPSRARADTDDAFLAQLRNHGIQYSSDDYAIGMAHAICSDLYGGTTPDNEAQQIADTKQASGWTITLANSQYLVGSAIGFYCPDPAHPTNDAFLAKLHDEGISYTSAAFMIQLANEAICYDLRNGASPADVAQRLEQVDNQSISQSLRGADLGYYQGNSQLLVNTAQAFYCPAPAKSVTA